MKKIEWAVCTCGTPLVKNNFYKDTTDLICVQCGKQWTQEEARKLKKEIYIK